MHYAELNKDKRVIIIYTDDSNSEIPYGMIKLSEHNPDYIGKHISELDIEANKQI